MKIGDQVQWMSRGLGGFVRNGTILAIIPRGESAGLHVPAIYLDEFPGKRGHNRVSISKKYDRAIIQTEEGRLCVHPMTHLVRRHVLRKTA